MVKVNERKSSSKRVKRLLAKCAVGTPVELNGQTNIIIEKNCHTVDVVSVDFKRKMRLSNELNLPIASEFEILINW